MDIKYSSIQSVKVDTQEKQFVKVDYYYNDKLLKTIYIAVIKGEIMENENFYISFSKLGKMAGWGLFSKKKIYAKPKTPKRLIKYQGEYLTLKSLREKLRKKENNFIVSFSGTAIEYQHKKNPYIAVDANPYITDNPLERLAGFANHLEGEYKNAISLEYFGSNIEKEEEYVKEYGVESYLWAIHDIKEDDEIFWDYGKQYWRDIPGANLIIFEGDPNEKKLSSPPLSTIFTNSYDIKIPIEINRGKIIYHSYDENFEPLESSVIKIFPILTKNDIFFIHNCKELQCKLNIISIINDIQKLLNKSINHYFNLNKYSSYQNNTEYTNIIINKISFWLNFKQIDEELIIINKKIDFKKRSREKMMKEDKLIEIIDINKIEIDIIFIINIINTDI